MRRAVLMDSIKQQVPVRVDQQLAVERYAEIVRQVVVPQDHARRDVQGHAEHLFRAPRLNVRCKSMVTVRQDGDVCSDPAKLELPASRPPAPPGRDPSLTLA